MSVCLHVVISRGIGKARTQLHAAAFAAAPLALSMVSDATHKKSSIQLDIMAINHILASILEERRRKRRVVVKGVEE